MHGSIALFLGLMSIANASPVKSLDPAPTRASQLVSPVTPGPSLNRRQNGFPYTSTAWNSGVVAYASSTVVDSNTTNGLGSSTTLMQGTSITLQMNPTDYVNAGLAATESVQSSLYTAVSNALTTGCPSPTSGQTVTACPSIPAVTGIAYFRTGNLDVAYDGELEISIEETSFTDWDDFILLVNTIASGVATSAHNPNNSEDQIWYNPGDGVDVTNWSGEGNFTNIPSSMLAILTTETEETNGQVLLQDLGVSFTSVQGGSAFSCSDASLVLSGMAAAAALAPGFNLFTEDEAAAEGVVSIIGSLSFANAGSLARFGLSMGCAAPNFKRDVEA